MSRIRRIALAAIAALSIPMIVAAQVPAPTPPVPTPPAPVPKPPPMPDPVPTPGKDVPPIPAPPKDPTRELVPPLPGGPTVAADETGFKPIFNGKDLTGWVYGTKKGKDGKESENKAGKGYQIKEGGILYCTKGDGGNLYTEKEYDNFA